MRLFLLCVVFPPIGAVFVLLQISKVAAMAAVVGIPVPTPAVIFRVGFAAYMLIPVTLITIGTPIFRSLLKKRRERQRWPAVRREGRLTASLVTWSLRLRWYRAAR